MGLETRPECSWSVGEGQATLKRPNGQNVFMDHVSINGAEAGTFVVDTGATLVVLSKCMADKLRLDLNGAPLLLAQTANGISAGTGVVLDQVSVQGLRTNHVAAAITDGLGPIDGLLGMGLFHPLPALARRRHPQNLDPQALKPSVAPGPKACASGPCSSLEQGAIRRLAGGGRAAGTGRPSPPATKTSQLTAPERPSNYPLR